MVLKQDKNAVFSNNIFMVIKTNFVVQQLTGPKDFCQKIWQKFLSKNLSY